MDVYILILCLSVTIATSTIPADPIPYEQLFKKYVIDFHRPYTRNVTEYKRRYSIFKSNLMHSDKLNSTRSYSGSAYYGVTEFSDLTPSEFKEKYLSSYQYDGGRIKEALPLLRYSGVRDYPPSMDWRKYNIITPIKNQKACGGCWAFSAVETIESMNAKKMNKAEELSVQELIDCSDGASGLYGCRGGDILAAMMWLRATKYPIVTEKSYPVTDRTQFCKFAPRKTKGVLLANYTCASYLNEYDMVRQLAKHGPLTVSVDATNWMNYQGGVIQYHCDGPANNHAVQIVGYNTSAEVPYFIIRNSWGTKFGHDGYLYVKIGGNTCGIAREVVTLNVL